MYAIAFSQDSLKDFAEIKQFSQTSIDTDSYVQRVTRQRSIEIECCEQRGFPFYQIVNDRRDWLSGERCCTRIYDRHFVQIKNLQSVILLFLSNGIENVSMGRRALERAGGTMFVSASEERRVLYWYQYINTSYIKRKTRYLSVSEWVEFLMRGSVDVGWFKELTRDSQIFVKTTSKSGLEAKVLPTCDLLKELGYISERLSDDSHIIFSEPIDIVTGQKGKEEYRVFVLNGEVLNASLYIDYDDNYEVPDKIFLFAKSFVQAHKEFFSTYVLDIAIEVERGPVVVELNNFSAAGRYEKNTFIDVVRALERKSA